MIKPLVFALLFFFPFLNAYSSLQLKTIADTGYCKMEILEIHKKKSAYIIYSRIEKDSSLIAIVTFKKRHRYGEKIKIGEKYTFRIFPYYKDDILPNHSILFVIIKDGKKVNVPSTGWMSNVYTSPDLEGLRIVDREIYSP